MNAEYAIDRAREQSDATAIDMLDQSDEHQSIVDREYEYALRNPIEACETVHGAESDAIMLDALHKAMSAKSSFLGISIHGYPTHNMIGGSLSKWRADLAEQYADKVLRELIASGDA